MAWIPTVYSSILLWMYIQVASRFTLTSNAGIHDLDHASLCTCAFISVGQLDFYDEPFMCLSAIWNSFSVNCLFTPVTTLSLVSSSFSKNPLYRMHNNLLFYA